MTATAAESARRWRHANRGMGFLGDDVNRLQAALNYLRG